MIKRCIILIITLLISIHSISAEELSDHDNLFDWAELTFPDFFSSADVKTYSAKDGNFLRYYPDTQNWIEVIDEAVYVYGKNFLSPDGRGEKIFIRKISELMPEVIPSSTFQERLNNAKPGDIVCLYGQVDGSISISISGTLEQPITIRGIGVALIKGSSSDQEDNNGLSIVNSQHLIIENIQIETFQRGMLIESSSNILVEDIKIDDIGHEGIKIRHSSSYIHIKDTVVSNTGKLFYTCFNSVNCGESVYVGDDLDKWADSENPDQSSFITLENITSINASSNGFDIKEGSHHIKIINSTVINSGESSYYIRADDIQIIDSASIGCDNKKAAFEFMQIDSPNIDVKVKGTCEDNNVFGCRIELKGVVINNASKYAVKFHNNDIADTATIYEGGSVFINGKYLTIYDTGFFENGDITVDHETNLDEFHENQW